MDWLQFSLTTSKDQVETISASLNAAGALAITLAENEDQPVYQLSTEEMPLWDRVKLIALFAADFDKTSIDQSLSAAGSWQVIVEEDWLYKWKEDLKPMLFGGKLWICPSWCEIPDPQAINIILDPEMAFGTGSHPTTALCLEWITENIKAGDIVVDYGCGSGILGIAAAKFGASKIYAVDIDPVALDVSNTNAQKNAVSASRFETFLPQDMPAIKADVVIANILAGPLMELAPILIGFLKPGAKLILSGILAEQANGLEAYYKKWLQDTEVAQQNEWVRITGKSSCEPTVALENPANNKP